MVSAEQLAGCGFSGDAIRLAATRGQLTRIHQGVFSIGHPPIGRTAWLFGATLAGGDGALLSHRFAGAHLSLISFRSAPVEITVPTAGGRSRPGISFHRRTLGPEEGGRFRGVPCTSPSRTILDLGGIGTALAERAIREAGGLGLLDVAEILRLIDRYPGRAGNARVRTLIEGRVPIPAMTKSELERRLYELCRSLGILLPDMNVPIYAGSQVIECDAVWPAERLIVECDSRWHDNPVTARRDAERDEALMLAGWRVLRLRWGRIVLAPHRTARRIEALLAQQRRLLSLPG